MRLHVGTDSLRGDIAAYARRFDMLELLAERGRLPRTQRLAEMKRAVNERFVFSLRLPGAVASLEWGADAEAGVAYAAEVADVPVAWGAPHPERGTLSLKLRLPEGGVLGDVLRALEERGWAVQGVSTRETSLEDAFIRIVGRGLDDAGPPA